MKIETTIEKVEVKTLVEKEVKTVVLSMEEAVILAAVYGNGESRRIPKRLRTVLGQLHQEVNATPEYIAFRRTSDYKYQNMVTFPHNPQ